MKTKIGIIGAGNMGQAIIEGVKSKYTVLACEQDKRRVRSLKKKMRIRFVDLKTLAEEVGTIILAVKPQRFSSVLKELSPLVKRRHLIISIAAGITTRFIEKNVGGQVRVVRTMPNLPAQIGQGMTGVSKGAKATTSDLNTTKQIFSCIGKVIIVQEKLLDAVTAVSGSGPAYLFQFVESLENAARSVGLKKPEAQILVFETLKGSLNLLEVSQENAASLRRRVTSKGGTTQAALKSLTKNKFNKVINDAVKAAQRQSKKLAR